MSPGRHLCVDAGLIRQARLPWDLTSTNAVPSARSALCLLCDCPAHAQPVCLSLNVTSREGSSLTHLHSSVEQPLQRQAHSPPPTPQAPVLPFGVLSPTVIK